MKTPFIFSFLLLFVWLQLTAQSNGVSRIEQLTTKDGLSHRWTTCVHQDARGYLWIGTYDGLNRYDGNEFITYRPSASGKFPVGANLIYQIAETNTGQFFLTTANGLLHFDPVNEVFDAPLKADSVNPSIIFNTGSGAPILENNLLYWTSNGSPIKFYELTATGELKLISIPSPMPLPAINIVPVLWDKQFCWFWDFRGAYFRANLGNGEWSRIDVKDSALVPVDKSGTLWIPDGDHLHAFLLPEAIRYSNWTTFNFEQGRIAWLFSEPQPDTYTIYKIDINENKFETAIPGLFDEGFDDYSWTQPFRPFQYQDKENTMWFASFYGLFKVRKAGNLFQHYLSTPVLNIKSPPSGMSCRLIIEDDYGKLYMQSFDNILYKVDPKSGARERIRLPVHQVSNDKIEALKDLNSFYVPGTIREWITSMTKDPEGYIWMSSLTNLFRYNPANGTFREYDVHAVAISKIISLGKDRIWITAYYKNYMFNYRTGDFQERTGVAGSELYHVTMVFEENVLWGVMDQGLIKINTDNFNIQRIQIYDRPREQRALVSHHGWLWLGTSSGLEKVDPLTYSHTNFDRSKGLPGNFIYSIVADGDYLWLGTSDGLCRFEVETGAVKNFYVEDGLSHNEFNSTSTLKAHDGMIYMGGLNGVNGFNPADLNNKTSNTHDILLSRLSVFDTDEDSLLYLSSESSMTGVTLTPSISSLEIHLALTSFVDPSRNQYAWRMEGLDEDWYYAGNQHVAIYHRIPPGHYTFRAKAADSFGNWSKNELEIPITVLSPWYSRWWAWMIYVMAVGGATFALYRVQLRRKLEHSENLRLQELDNFKSRFFTNITHEFRTPLTVILGISEQVESKVNGDIKNKVGLIRRNGQNLLRLINQILDLAKLESHTLKINYVQGDVLPYIRYITESLQSFANAQNVMLRVESNEGEIVMDYDPERLLQIVHNLLSNAIKFTPGGGKVILKVNTEIIGSKNLHSLNLVVIDNGVGVSKEDLPHLFDRFYQANNLEKAKAGGTGIGLSLTKELVKAMDGEISVESEVGKGTQFMVTLPIITSSSTPKANDGKLYTEDITETSPNGDVPSSLYASSAFSALSTSSAHLPKILVIEDNPDVVEYLTICLRENYQIDYAYNGRSGIEKTFEIVPDIIVSDVMMPEKDGFEVCETLKNDERSSHIPIVLLTAKADVESRIAGLRRGADAYLSKPFHREELLVTLKNLLDLRRRLQSKYADTALAPAVFMNTVSDNGDHPTDNIENEFLQKLRTFINDNLSDAELDVDTLCRQMGMSRTNLHNKLTALTGISTTIFVRKLRLQKAKELLQNTEMNISEVAYEVGFNDPKFFSRVFSQEFGSPPSSLKMK